METACKITHRGTWHNDAHATNGKQVGVKTVLNPSKIFKGGAIYLSKLIKRVPKSVQHPDNVWFAMASYNVGWGHGE